MIIKLTILSIKVLPLERNRILSTFWFLTSKSKPHLSIEDCSLCLSTCRWLKVFYRKSIISSAILPSFSIFKKFDHKLFSFVLKKIITAAFFFPSLVLDAVFWRKDLSSSLDCVYSPLIDYTVFLKYCF